MSQFRKVAKGDRFVHYVLPSAGLVVEAQSAPAPVGDGTVWTVESKVVTAGGQASRFANVGSTMTLTYFPDTDVTVIENVEHSDVVRICIDVEVIGGVDPVRMQALANLADVMFVQAEDGLYTDGAGRDGEGTFLASFGAGTRVASIKKVEA